MSIEVPQLGEELLEPSSRTEEPRGWEDLGLAPWVEPAYRRLRPLLPTAGSLLGIYAVARLVAFMGDLFAAHINYGGNLAGPLTSWDASWYLRVAQTFYPAHAATVNGQLTYGAAGFEPVFPALIRLLMFPGLTPLEAATVVSLLGGAAATILVWRLGSALADEEVGRIAAIFFVLFPGMGVVWGLLYSECVGFALVAGSLLLMAHKRWVWSGIVGALATATSPMALPLVLAAVAAVVVAFRRREKLGPLATVFLVPLGFVGYVLYLGLRYHDILFWWHLQHQAWGAQIDFGRSLLHLLWNPLSGGYQGKGWMEWIGVVVVAIAIAAIAKARLAWPASAYCLGVFVLAFVSNSLGFKPRFVAWAFPALIALAALTRRRGWQGVALLFAGVMPFVLLLYTMNGNYIVQP